MIDSDRDASGAEKYGILGRPAWRKENAMPCQCHGLHVAHPQVSPSTPRLSSYYPNVAQYILIIDPLVPRRQSAVKISYLNTEQRTLFN